MVYSFLDHSQALYSQPERRAVETFLRQFVPLLLMLPEAEFNAACGPLEPAHAEEMASDANGMVDGAGVPASDLRKKLLETAHETGLASRAASSPPDRGTPSDDLKTSTTDDIWIREAATNQPAGTYANGVSNPRRMPFFANSTYYTLLRLLQVMYCGLSLCAIRLLIADWDSFYARDYSYVKKLGQKWLRLSTLP
jgi:paired amphipathic helix protein Sin3a